jgi:predicted HicB family RNase H-like nuclease
METVAPAKEYKVAFNLQLPQSLHTRLSFYADNFAIGRKSSVTNIIITAIEQHLGDLEKKAGI